MIAHPEARARTATLVVVGPPERVAESAAALATGQDAGALHVVHISTTGQAQPGDHSPADVLSIDGLRAEYVDNAIAAVRLSSLPTIVWWRGGAPEGVDGVASLADRVILDAPDPLPLWRRVPPLFDHAAITDLRWARLTRWRAAMAHFFDLAEIRAAAASFTSLTITGNDRFQCALFAGWLDSSIGWNGRVPTQYSTSSSLPMESVVLASGDGALRLHLMPNRTCLETEARLATKVLAARVVSVGDQSLATLLSEELRVRSRDLAFERALQTAIRTL